MDSRWFVRIFLVLSSVAAQTVYNVFDAPTLTNSDSVQFFYLEAPFPYNAPATIISAAGSNFDHFGVSHAGLGVWDTTTDVKFSIEFLSQDYVGGLLPSLSGGSTITWENAAEIVVTNPLVESRWLNSRLVTTTTGSSWNQMLTYLQDNTALFTTYQPVTGLYLNHSLINSSIVYSTDDISTIGELVISPKNSFAFVDAMVSQLGSYGCDLGAFLQIYATSFDYLSDKREVPPIVQLSDASVNAEVYNWYEDLTVCYTNALNAAAQVTNGAQFFFRTLQQKCYGEYAFVYYSNDAVYNLSLGNISDGRYLTPMLNQYIYELPPNDSGTDEQLEVIDYIVVAVAFLAACYGIYYFAFKFFGKKQRRRVSFEGERIAARTVENMTDGMDDDEHEHRAYFHGKDEGSSMSASWSKAFPIGKLSMQGNPLSTRSSKLSENEVM